MSLNQLPELQSFFSNYIAASDSESDLQNTKAFLASASADKVHLVIAQAKDMMNLDSIVEDLGMEANRWFGDANEAKNWLSGILELLGQSDSNAEVIVKDSNGTILNEGDSVTVIKDLKVKGGSSDLKRGDLIKKIRLIGDPENIECNVNGSTLVLKTMFLKKA
jgi:protein PhnA